MSGPRCAECGYDLAMLPQKPAGFVRCPECGRHQDVRFPRFRGLTTAHWLQSLGFGVGPMLIALCLQIVVRWERPSLLFLLAVLIGPIIAGCFAYTRVVHPDPELEHVPWYRRPAGCGVLTAADSLCVNLGVVILGVLLLAALR